MKQTLQALLDDIGQAAFAAVGAPAALGVFSPSDRPDLSDFQCIGAMRAAAALHINPRAIAEKVVQALQGQAMLGAISVDGPGFINVRLDEGWLAAFVATADPQAPAQPTGRTYMLDYGGPNVAKALHVGHLRSAVIGESLKRMIRAVGHTAIADVHLGDWGTPMGMLIAHFAAAHPDWPYFDESRAKEWSDFRTGLSVDDLCVIYPQASMRFKEDPAFAAEARAATQALQTGHAGYRALWAHLVGLSVGSVRADFAALGVSFDLWRGESSVNDIIPSMLDDLKNRGVAIQSQGAWVIPVARESDKAELPPLILQKSDGGYTYATTDLATILARVQEFQPDGILYVVDQRQSLHFTQLFRAAALAGFIDEERLEHDGFGTVNGPDGKPFRTRAGGTMRLGDLVDLARDEVRAKVGAGDTQDPAIATMIEQIAVAAVKFGDLSVYRKADYIFDPAAFVQLEGKTGPYLQYAGVRIYSVLDKAAQRGFAAGTTIMLVEPAERALALRLAQYRDMLARAFEHRAPSEVCDYAFGLAQAFSAFYQNCPVLTAPTEELRASRLTLAAQTLATMHACAAVIGFDLPQRMLSLEQNEERAG